MYERNFLSTNLLSIKKAVESATPVPEQVTLVAASKTQSASIISSAYSLGLRHFGENYLDEALDKMQQLQELDITWHFIGRIQSNKTKEIANRFDWVHCVDRQKIAQRLNNQRQHPSPLNVLIQVNIDGDPNKAGTQPEATLALAQYIAQQPKLRLRGLMTILSADTNPRAGYGSVAQLAAKIGEQLTANLEPYFELDLESALESGLESGFESKRQVQWDSLSMGMSADIAAAVAEGATHIRVGTALFGPRQNKPSS